MLLYPKIKRPMKTNFFLRKFRLLLYLFFFVISILSQQTCSNNERKELKSAKQNNGDKNNVPSMKPAYRLLPIGAIKPQGWIYEQMQIDLSDGLKGHFPKISNNVTQELFSKQHRQPGTLVRGARDDRKEKAWWAGEHEGYWMDNIARSAILLDDKEHLSMVQKWVEDIIVAFEKTGYIGIYDAQTRFPASGFDGELWTQSRAFQALLTWYEYTGDSRILNAVTTTVRTTIEHYRKGTYFGRPGSDGGVTHGVGYMDTLEWLYRLTGDPYFAEAAVWLYADYSENVVTDFDDLTVKAMRDRDLPWFDHGAHVGEAIHMPEIAYFFSGNPAYKEAANNVLPKLERHTNPAGGMTIGYLESVAGEQGGGHVLNENCAHIESMMSLNRLFMYQPEMKIGNWREKCMFNVVQGARLHPADRAVSYHSRDNRLHAADAKVHGGRELFSACHTAAACCVLNVPRAMPYYIEGMWYASNESPGLLANGYGPSVLKTSISNVKVNIEQLTDYPFSDKITFNIAPERKVKFEIVLRIPPNSGNVKIDAGNNAKITTDSSKITIMKSWKQGDKIEVDFDFNAIRKVQPNGKEAYWEWGALVFTLPFETQEEIIATINANDSIPSGFFEYLLKPVNHEGWNYIAGIESTFKLIKVNGDPTYPYFKPTINLEGNLYDRNGKEVIVRLVPFGSAPLRRTTFPFNEIIPANAGSPSAGNVTIDNDPMRFF